MAWPVLLLARELDLGGSERQMTEIAKTLDRSRFIPHVGCFRPQGIRNAELAARGVPIVHFPVDSFASFGAICQAWRLAELHPAARHPAGAHLRLSDDAVRRSRCALGDARSGGVQPALPSFVNTTQIPPLDSHDRSYVRCHCRELRICRPAPAKRRRRSERADPALL